MKYFQDKPNLYQTSKPFEIKKKKKKIAGEMFI